ncbi:hypothetical protein C4564_02170 [Candidatus Microgenomates bacterium]|nr:MAG: hypothetical protein C4564_02170 [Candidatus Microgenomates bacterium]
MERGKYDFWVNFNFFSNGMFQRVAGAGGPPRREPLVGILGGKRLTGPASEKLDLLICVYGTTKT